MGSTSSSPDALVSFDEKQILLDSIALVAVGTFQVTCDTQGKILEVQVNQDFEKNTGVKADRLQTLRDWLGLIPRADRHHFLIQLRQLGQADQQVITSRMFDLQGEVVLFRALVRRTILDAGRVLFSGTLIDPLKAQQQQSDNHLATEPRHFNKTFAKHFQYEQQLIDLISINNRLMACPTPDAICKQAIVELQQTLGFDRASIWFINDEETLAHGTYGVDISGEVCDERMVSFPLEPDFIEQIKQLTPYGLKQNTDLFDSNHHVVGQGETLWVPIVDRHQTIGLICIDNLLTHKPIEELNIKIAAMLASQISHLLSVRELDRTLEFSQRRLLAAQDFAKVGYWDYEIQTDRMICSDQVYQIMGLTSEQDCSTCSAFLEMVLPEDREKIEENYHQILEDGRPFDLRFRVQLSDEQVSHIHARGELVFDLDGQPIRMAGMLQDVTENVQTQHQLQKAQDELQWILTTNPTVAYIRDADTDKYLFINDHVEQLTGYTATYFMDQPQRWGDRIHPDDLQNVLNNDYDITGNLYDVATYRIRHRDGHYRTVQNHVHRLVDEHGQLRRSLGFIADITDTLETEHQLQKTQHDLTMMLESNPAITYMVQTTPEHRCVYMNRQVEKALGYEASYFTSHPTAWRDQIHPDDLHIVEPYYQEHDYNASQVLEYRFKHHNGEYRHLRNYVHRISPEGDEHVMVMGFITDITDEVETSHLLENTRNELAMAMEASPLVTYIDQVVPEHACKYVSPRIEEVLGWSPNYFIHDRSFLESQIHPEDRPKLKEAIEQTMEHKSAVVEYRIRHSDGSYRYLQEHMNLMPDQIHMLGFVADITTLKNVELSLRQERDLLNGMLRASVSAITVVSPTGDIIFANDKAQEVLGIARSEIQMRKYDAPEWQITDYQGNPFPEDQLPFARVMATGKLVEDVRHAIQWPDGERKLLSINGDPLFDEQGQIEAIVFCVQDITHQIQAEQALAESGEHYRELAQTNQRLLDEVNHRVRNNLAGLLGLLRLGDTQHPETQAFAQALQGRVSAMNQIHNLLVDTQWNNIDLRSLIQTLARYDIQHEQQQNLRLHGPDVALPPNMATAMAMIFQELFTNAQKHGAYANASKGNVTVQWDQITWQDKPAIELTWQESHGPGIKQSDPAYSDGLKLIQGFAEYQLHGQCELNFPPMGVNHHFILPLPQEA